MKKRSYSNSNYCCSNLGEYVLEKSKEHITELQKIYGYSDKDNKDNIEIVISDEKPQGISFARSEKKIKNELTKIIEKTGDSNLPDGFKRIKKLIGDYRDWESSFEQEKEKPFYNPENDWPKAECIIEKSFRRLEGELRARSSIRLGEFRSSKKKDKIGTIVIYIDAIEHSKYAENNVILDATIAHEAFHAFHYSCFKYKGWEDSWSATGIGWEKSIVQESLAAAYEYKYCRDLREQYHVKFKELCKEQINDWKEMDISYWPYSGALGILQQSSSEIPQIDISKAKELLKYSLIDWKAAAIECRIGYDSNK